MDNQARGRARGRVRQTDDAQPGSSGRYEGGRPRHYEGNGQGGRPYEGGSGNGGGRPYDGSGGSAAGGYARHRQMREMREAAAAGGSRPYEGSGGSRPYEASGGSRPYEGGGGSRPYQAGGYYEGAGGRYRDGNGGGDSRQRPRDSSSSSSRHRDSSSYRERGSDYPRPPQENVYATVRPAQASWEESQSKRQRMRPPSPAAPAPPAEVLPRAGGSSAPAQTQIARPAPPADGNGGGRGAHRGRRPIPEPTVPTRLVTGKQGCSGSRVNLQTNYFAMEKRADWSIYQYRVDFTPDLESTGMKKKLFYTAIEALNMKGLFDGTILFTPHRITPDPKEFDVDSLTDSSQKIHIVARKVGVVDKSSYHYMQVYNLIIRKCLRHLDLKLVGRDYFDPMNKITCARLNLDLWPGVLSSVRQHEKDVLMCAEIKHKVMKHDTALDLLRREMSDARNHGQGDTKFTDKILNTYVLTEYNNKTYAVNDVDFSSTPLSTFEKKDGTVISFAEYFKTRHGITIRNMTQPLLISQSKERDLRGGASEVVKLIPELCRLTGLTAVERANRAMMSEIADYMRPTPSSRIKSLRHFNARLQSVPKCITELKQWDVSLSKDIISISARQLPTEQLFVGNNSSYSATPEADWTKNMRSRTMYRNGEMDCWAIIHPPRDEMETRTFYGHMRKAIDGMKWRTGDPMFHRAEGINFQAYSRAIDEVRQRLPEITIYFIAMPGQRPGSAGSLDLYAFIKKKLTVEMGIASQLVTRNTMTHRSAFSIATKVAVQMNCKVGGAPWTIKVPIENLMVCGYDVCHDPKDKRKSFGAFVASYDQGLSAFFSTVEQHPDGEELSSYIGLSFTKAVSYYARNNKGALPDRILFYRDGVGESQFNHVYEFELGIIKSQLTPMYANAKKPLRLRVIVVNKRVNTRFFLNGANPRPGTIVDDVVTLPHRTDFFLIPQCTRQGTVTPTYYNVLGPDEFGIDMDKIQILTNRMCHQYYNWSGTVRVPAPCQYAHKLAFLAAQSLHRPPNSNLEHLLHYL